MPTGCYLELYDKNKKLSYRWQTARCICADHLKPHLSLTCVTIPHMVILCQTVWALVGEGCLKIWVRWGPAILGWGLVNLLKTRPSPICGITPHLVVLIKGFEHTYGVPKIWARLGPASWDEGRAWPLTNSPVPTWVNMPYLIAVGQTMRAYDGDLPENLGFHAALQSTRHTYKLWRNKLRRHNQQS